MNEIGWFYIWRVYMQKQITLNSWYFLVMLSLIKITVVQLKWIGMHNEKNDFWFWSYPFMQINSSYLINVWYWMIEAGCLALLHLLSLLSAFSRSLKLPCLVLTILPFSDLLLLRPFFITHDQKPADWVLLSCVHIQKHSGTEWECWSENYIWAHER